VGCTFPVVTATNSIIFNPATDTWTAAPANCNCKTGPPGVVGLPSAFGSKPLMVYASEQTAAGPAVFGSSLVAADGTSFTPVVSQFTSRSLTACGAPTTGPTATGMSALATGQVLLAGGQKAGSPLIGLTDTWLYTPAIP
jgi:hypothetical protein